MNRLPAIHVAAVLAAAALVVPASAAGSCKVLTDFQGDAGVARTFVPVARNDAAIDVVSAGFGSDERTLTVALRVLDLGAEEVDTTTGARYAVSFTAQSSAITTFVAHAWRAVDGTTGGEVVVQRSFFENSPPGPVTAVFDVARDEVRISVPMTWMRQQVELPRGTPLTDIRARTGPYVHQPAAGVVVQDTTGPTADYAHSAFSYRTGTPSCVKPGA